MPRQVLHSTTTPDGRALELALEGSHYVLRVEGLPLMTSAAHGSERAMAELARDALGSRNAARVLVGGLGFGFTLRATLDAFGRGAEVTVAELLPQVVRYNRDLLGHLAGHPLADPRVALLCSDVREPLSAGSWDAVLMDVDNGPRALTVASNAALYDLEGAQQMARALRPGGVLVLWSTEPDAAFEARLARAGLQVQARAVKPRAADLNDPQHTLFLATRASPPRRGAGRKEAR